MIVEIVFPVLKVNVVQPVMIDDEAATITPSARWVDDGVTAVRMIFELRRWEELQVEIVVVLDTMMVPDELDKRSIAGIVNDLLNDCMVIL